MQPSWILKSFPFLSRVTETSAMNEGIKSDIRIDQLPLIAHELVPASTAGNCWAPSDYQAERGHEVDQMILVYGNNGIGVKFLEEIVL